MKYLLPPSANTYLDTRNTVIFTVLIGAVLLFFWVIGKTDRVVYIGADHQVPAQGQIALKTEPAGFYFIDRNAIHAAMKSGCRYDLSYAPEFGRNSNSAGRAKHIRSATLVDCP